MQFLLYCLNLGCQANWVKLIRPRFAVFVRCCCVAVIPLVEKYVAVA